MGKTARSLEFEHDIPAYEKGKTLSPHILKKENNMREEAGPLGMEVVFPFWRDGVFQTPSEEAPQMKKHKSTSAHIERTPQTASLTMNFETKINQVLKEPATDENAVKIWQLRGRQATMATLEGEIKHRIARFVFNTFAHTPVSPNACCMQNN